MIKNICERCEERNDARGSFAMTRVGLCSDLVAEEAVYHSRCRVRFFDKSSCSSSTQKKNPRGRPANSSNASMQDSFNHMCVWIKNDNELYTLDELRIKMLEDSVDSEVYGVKRLKQKLQEKYKDFVFFAEICGML